jgi:hypothetical protein
LPCRFKDIVDAQQVHGEQAGVKVVLVGHSRQMENSRDAFACFLDRLKIPNVALNELVITFWLHWLDVKQPKGKMLPQKRHNLRSNPAARTGDQNPLPHADTSVQLKLWQRRFQVDRILVALSSLGSA